MSLVPSTRLLWLVFYAALVGVGAGPLPELVPVWLLALGSVGLAALVDAGLSLSRAQPPTASVPAVGRFMRDRAGTVPLTFTNPDRRARRVRVALGLPAAFVSRDEEVWVELPAEAERADTAWRWHATLMVPWGPHAPGQRFGPGQLRIEPGLIVSAVVL